MIRFQSQVFTESCAYLDEWLNKFVAKGLYVKVVGYVAYGEAGYVQVTVMTGSRDEMAPKKTLVESQPEEFEEPAIKLDLEDEPS